MGRQRGFTLLELLVALSIFGLVSVMAFTGLDSSLKARQTTEAQSERLIRLQKAFNLMREDFEQALPRPVRDQQGDLLPQSAFQQEGEGVSFTRGGRANPLGLKRSSLERVGWGLRDGKLTRIRWQALDQPFEPKAEELPLLEDIDELRFRFMGADKRWQEQWPPVSNQPNAGPQLPLAVEVTLETKDLGEIVRIFLLPF